MYPANKIYPETITLEDGLKDAANGIWNITEVNKKPYFEYIDENLSGKLNSSL